MSAYEQEGEKIRRVQALIQILNGTALQSREHRIPESLANDIKLWALKELHNYFPSEEP